MNPAALVADVELTVAGVDQIIAEALQGSAQTCLAVVGALACVDHHRPRDVQRFFFMVGNLTPRRSRTPGPPSNDFASLSINSTPAASSARRHLFTVASFGSLPQNSKRLTVSAATPASSASLSRDQPTKALAARS